MTILNQVEYAHPVDDTQTILDLSIGMDSEQSRTLLFASHLAISTLQASAQDRWDEREIDP